VARGGGFRVRALPSRQLPGVRRHSYGGCPAERMNEIAAAVSRYLGDAAD
jgi:hypothetical protein